MSTSFEFRFDTIIDAMPFIYFQTHSLTHTLIHSLTHSLTHTHTL